jgi:DnaK suppressor protein
MVDVEMTAVKARLEELANAGSDVPEVLRERIGGGNPTNLAQGREAQAVALETVRVMHTLAQQALAALDRLADGSFGVCLECETPIAPKRIIAAPWAARCIHCQEEGHSSHSMAVAA